MPHGEQTTSLVKLALLAMNVPTPQVLTVTHADCPVTFLNVPVGQLEHTRSLVVVGAIASYSPTLQFDTVMHVLSVMLLKVMPGTHDTHCRSDVDVGATDCCRPALHTVRREHIRSLVLVGATDWYSELLLQVVNSEHTVSLRTPQGAFINSVVELQAVQLRH